MKTMASSNHQKESPSTSSFLMKLWRFNRLLTLSAVLHALLIPLIFVAMIIDPKIITGANAWIKPLKFAISGSIYCFTFVWLITYVQGMRWWVVQGAAYITGIAMAVETGLITFQVIRGTTSHFNHSTAFDEAIYSAMGGFVMLLSLAGMITAICLLFQRMDNRVFAWSLRLGILVSLVGMNLAFLMTARPTPIQQEILDAGGTPTTSGAHSVGVEDGGVALPFVGWSTEGGDLRAPHFVGLHAMQILPLLGWLLTRPNARKRFSEMQRVLLVWTSGLAYLGLVGLLTWQALRGQSIIAPDAFTLAAFGAIVGAALLVVVGVALRPQKPLAIAE